MNREVGDNKLEPFPFRGKGSRSVKASAAKMESMRALPFGVGFGDDASPQKIKAAEPLRSSRTILQRRSLVIRSIDRDGIRIKEDYLRCVRQSSSIVCLVPLAGEAVSVQRRFQHQIKRFRNKTEFMLGNGQAAFVSFHGRIKQESGRQENNCDICAGGLDYSMPRWCRMDVAMPAASGSNESRIPTKRR